MIGPAIRHINRVQAGGTVPRAGLCCRVKTDQADFPEAIYDPTAAWTELINPGGASSGGNSIIVFGLLSAASGRWVSFRYQRINTGNFAFAVEWQQYLILADCTGTFIDGEDLYFYETAAPVPADSLINTATPVTQDEVQCSTGRKLPGVVPPDPPPPWVPDGTLPCPPHYVELGYPYCFDCLSRCWFERTGWVPGDPDPDPEDVGVCPCMTDPSPEGFHPPEYVFRDYTVHYGNPNWLVGEPPAGPIAYGAATLPLATSSGPEMATTNSRQGKTIAVIVHNYQEVSASPMAAIQPLESPGIILPGSTITIPGKGPLVLSNPLGTIRATGENVDPSQWPWPST